MRAYGKSWDYNVYDCRCCLYWKGRKKGCVYSDGCCCPVDQRDAAQFRDDEDKENTAPVSECRNCPYGRDSPLYRVVYQGGHARCGTLEGA